MAVRTLFIGLGGTGGVALSFARARLIARLDEAGWADPFPHNMWRFVHIDVPVQPDIGPRLRTAEQGSAVALGLESFHGDEYLGLTDRGLVYEGLDRQARQVAGDDGALYGWRPADPRQVRVPIERGAGMFRAVGALVAFARRQRIVEFLEQSEERLSSQVSWEEAQRVSRQLSGGAEGDQTRQPSHPLVVIVSSMVGGAGAGLFVDVASIARGLFGDQVCAFLVAPDAFNLDHIGQFAPANAWSLLSEIQHLAASEGSHGDADLSPVRFPPAGTTVSDTATTAKAIYVVGRRAPGVMLDGDGAAEGVVGEMLATSVTSDTVFNRMMNYAVTNRHAADVDQLGLGSSGVFRAVGFSRLELGRVRFRRYATDRLVRLAGDRLLSRELDLEAGERGEERLVDAIDRVAERLRYRLAEQCGLHELDNGRANDQILDALRPDPLPAWSRQRVLAQIGQGEVRVETVIGQLVGWADDQERGDEPAWQAELERRVAEWIGAIERQTVEAVWTVGARYGLPVAGRCLDYLMDDLRQSASQLRHPAEKVVSLEGQLGQRLSANSRTTASVAHREEASQVVAAYLEGRFEARARRAAADACEEVARHLVSPLRHAVEDAIRSMNVEGGEWVRALAVLPADGEIAAYLPGPHEVMIEPIDGFEDRLGEQIAATIGNDRRGDALAAAVDEILTGAVETLIRPATRWHPGRIGHTDHIARSFRAEVDVGLVSIRSSVDSWMLRPNFPLRSYLETGLGGFVQADSHNLTLLREAMGRLILVGAPLGNANQQVADVHLQPTSRRVLSELPFANHAAARDVVEATIRAAPDRRSFSDPIFVSNDVDSVTLMSDEGPYQALCFDAVMAPIRTAFISATQGGTDRYPERQSAYHQLGWRRQAVPLSMAGPLSAHDLVCLIAGYLVALAAGDLTPGTPWVVVDSEGRKLPFPAVSYPTDPQESRTYRTGIGRLVEDLKVAYLEASRPNQLGALRPYQILLGKGRQLAAVVAQLDENERGEARDLAQQCLSICRAERRPDLEACDPSTDIAELGHLLVEAAQQVIRALDADSTSVVLL